MSNNKDYEYKLRIHRLLWSMGYFCRREVKLKHGLPRGKVSEVTDLDIIGYKFDPMFIPDIIVGECKHKKKFKPYESVLKLRGVMEYFGARKGFLLNYSIPTDLWDFSQKFGVAVFDNDKLETLEGTCFLPPDVTLGMFDPEIDQKVKSFKEILNGTSYKLNVRYLDYEYWMDEPRLQIIKLISYGENLRKIKKPISDAAKWLISENILRFALSTLIFSSRFYSTKEDQLQSTLSSELLGGWGKKEKLTELFRSWHSFMSNYVQKKYREPIDIDYQDIVKFMVPPYVSHLADLIARLWKHPSHSTPVLQILDFVIYDQIERKGKIEGYGEIARLTGVRGDIKLCVKMAKNFIISYERCSGADISFLNDFLDLI